MRRAPILLLALLLCQLELHAYGTQVSDRSFSNYNAKSWKVHGPDVNGTYGGLHGTGGLEWITSGGQAVGIVSDGFGNAVASVVDGVVTWQTSKVGAYGPLPTSLVLTLESGSTLVEATVWKGNRVDPTGFIQLGVRPYDPAGGRFLSADPVGHGASMSLYCFANGDPVNFHDPDGYLAVGAWNLPTSVLGNPYVSGSLRTVGGVAQAGAGFAFAAGTSWTGVGAVGGVAVGLHGIDQAVAGIRTISSGQHQSSFTSMGIQRAGVSQPYADLIDSGISIAGSGGVALASRMGTTAPAIVRAPTGINPPMKVAPQLKTVTSWADEGITPDLNPGRWVQLGEATKINFLKTGLPGPKGEFSNRFPYLTIEKSKVPFTNSITDDLPASSLQWPSGLDKWRGIFGQRQIKGGGE